MNTGSVLENRPFDSVIVFVSPTHQFVVYCLCPCLVRHCRIIARTGKIYFSSCQPWATPFSQPVHLYIPIRVCIYIFAVYLWPHISHISTPWDFNRAWNSFNMMTCCWPFERTLYIFSLPWRWSFAQLSVFQPVRRLKWTGCCFQI